MKKVTKERIESRIVNERYEMIQGTTVTLCILTMINNFIVIGKSACVDPKAFDVKVGQQFAREDAINQLWPLEGYLLAEEVMRGNQHPLDTIARVCHEANKAYCEAMDDHSQKPWEDAPEWQRQSARMGVDFHLNGNWGPESSHVSWMSAKLSDGWKWGPVKDEEKKEHPCMVPFNELPREQQAKDHIFRAIVHAMK